MVKTASPGKWAFCILFPLLVYYFAPDAHPKMPLFFALTAWAVSVWATEILPPIPVAASLTFLYVLGKVATPQVVFAPWASFLPWMCLAALVVGEALEHSGLTKRLALRIMLLVGASFNRAVIGLMLTGMIMAFLLPDIMCRVIIFVAIAHGLVQALELDPRSRLSSALMMAGFCAATSPGYGYLTGTEMSLIASSIMLKVTGSPLNWMDYFIANFPFNVVYCCLSICMILFVIRGKERLANEENLHHVLSLKLKEMGPMSVLEWKVLGVLVVGIGGILTEKIHGMPGTFVYALVGMCCYLPFLNISKPEGVRHLNVSFIVFIVACLGIGSTAQSLGAEKWIAAQLVPVLETLSPNATVIATFCTSVGLKFMLTPLAAVSTFTGSIIEIATALNMDPRPLVYAFLVGLDQYIFPYEYALLLYTFTTGAITAVHLMKGLALRIVITGIGIACIQIPYWTFLGILN